MTDLSGQYLGRYYLAERLGEGGMAVVYKAYDTRLERDVAIKIIRSGAFPSDALGEILKRFEREAKSLAKLSHPNIVKVHDFGEHEGSPYLVMEYLSGGTLKMVMGKPVPWQEAVRLILPVARGVAYAHQRGILHRDIKPANILITDGGEPMLSDFGIAKLFEGKQTTALTESGMAIGTPEYMAPEQWMGTTSPQSDLYSLAIVLYEMLTGRKPYTADTPAAILIMQATEPLPSPSKFAEEMPEALESILIKALARESKNRYEDMNAFVGALEELTVAPRQTSPSLPEQKPVEGSFTIPSQKTLPTRSRSIWRMAGMIGGLIVLFAVGSWAIPKFSFAPPSETATLTQPPAPTASSTSSPAPSSATSTASATLTPIPSPMLAILGEAHIDWEAIPAEWGNDVLKNAHIVDKSGDFDYVNPEDVGRAGRSDALVDGDPYSGWDTSSGRFPHWIIFELSDEVTVDRIGFVNLVTGHRGITEGNNSTKDLEVYVATSEAPNDFKKLGEFTLTGPGGNPPEAYWKLQPYSFEPIRVKYVKVIIRSSYFLPSLTTKFPSLLDSLGAALAEIALFPAQ